MKLFILLLKLAASSDIISSDESPFKKQRWDSFQWDPAVEELVFAEPDTLPAASMVPTNIAKIVERFSPVQRVAISHVENSPVQELGDAVWKIGTKRFPDEESRIVFLRGMLEFPELNFAALSDKLYPEGCDWCRNFYSKRKLRGKMSFCAYTYLKNQYLQDGSIISPPQLLKLCGRSFFKSGIVLKAWIDIVIAMGSVPILNAIGQSVEMTPSEFAQLLEAEIGGTYSRISTQKSVSERSSSISFSAAELFGDLVSDELHVPLVETGSFRPVISPNSAAPIASAFFETWHVERLSYSDRICILYLMWENPDFDAKTLWTKYTDEVDTLVTVEQVESLLIEMLSKARISRDAYNSLLAFSTGSPLSSEMQSLWKRAVVETSSVPRFVEDFVYMTRSQYKEMISMIIEDESGLGP